MKDKIIKVGYLVSYDWKLLENSIPRIYREADIIVLALDKNRKTWAGNSFDFDMDSFNQLIRKIDVQNKISLYEEDFFEPSLSTMQNEVRERNMLAKQMGQGGWHIQFDADEYAINFSTFVQILKKIDPNPDPQKIKKPVNVSGSLITMIKKVENGFIYVQPQKRAEWCPFATDVPVYEHGRRNGYFNVLTPFFLVHESSSRSDEDFYFKLKNWGHNKDFDIDSYYALWKAIDGYNYQFIKDFNPLNKNDWPELAFAPAKNVDELVSYFASSDSPKPSIKYIGFKNSRNLARLRKVFQKLF